MSTISLLSNPKISSNSKATKKENSIAKVAENNKPKMVTPAINTERFDGYTVAAASYVESDNYFVGQYAVKPYSAPQEQTMNSEHITNSSSMNGLDENNSSASSYFIAPNFIPENHLNNSNAASTSIRDVVVSSEKVCLTGVMSAEEGYVINVIPPQNLIIDSELQKNESIHYPSLNPPLYSVLPTAPTPEPCANVFDFHTSGPVQEPQSLQTVVQTNRDQIEILAPEDILPICKQILEYFKSLKLSRKQGKIIVDFLQKISNSRFDNSVQDIPRFDKCFVKLVNDLYIDLYNLSLECGIQYTVEQEGSYKDVINSIVKSLVIVCIDSYNLNSPTYTTRGIDNLNYYRLIIEGKYLYNNNYVNQNIAKAKEINLNVPSHLSLHFANEYKLSMEKVDELLISAKSFQLSECDVAKKAIVAKLKQNIIKSFENLKLAPEQGVIITSGLQRLHSIFYTQESLTEISLKINICFSDIFAQLYFLYERESLNSLKNIDNLVLFVKQICKDFLMVNFHMKDRSLPSIISSFFIFFL